MRLQYKQLYRLKKQNNLTLHVKKLKKKTTKPKLVKGKKH